MLTPMWKRISSLTLAILLSACQSSIPSVSLESAEAAAHKVIESLVNSDFGVINQVVSQTLKEELDTDFQTQWKEISDTAILNGEYRLEDASAYSDGLFIGVLEGESTDVIIQLVFDGVELTQIRASYRKEEIENTTSEKFEEINIETGVASTLNGKLVLPVGIENPPVVILLQGSGPSNLNEEVYALKPFEDLAYGLAELGIASIRYDKRTYAYPNWMYGDQILAWEYRFDFEAVLSQLDQWNLEQSPVYLLGHSLGGMIAPWLASEVDKLAGVICLSATPRGLEDVIYDQNRATLMEKGMDEAQIEALLSNLAKQVEEVKKLDGTTERETLISMPTSYWLELNQTHPAAYLDNLDILILNAEKDFQVSVEKDYAAWEELTQGWDNVTLKLYPGLNHMMTESDVMSVEDYNTAKPLSPEVIEDIASWIMNGELKK